MSTHSEYLFSICETYFENRLHAPHVLVRGSAIPRPWTGGNQATNRSWTAERWTKFHLCCLHHHLSPGSHQISEGIKFSAQTLLWTAHVRDLGCPFEFSPSHPSSLSMENCLAWNGAPCQKGREPQAYHMKIIEDCCAWGGVTVPAQQQMGYAQVGEGRKSHLLVQNHCLQQSLVQTV